MHRALDNWDTQTIARWIGPQGWISPDGTTSGQPAQGTEPTNGRPAPGSTPGDGTTPAPLPPPREWRKRVAVEATEVAIVDQATAKRCAPDRVGEVLVRSGSIADGYLNRPEESEQTFRALIVGEDATATYLRTGDLGFLMEGEVFVTGRKKELIIIRGENRYPQDIEWTVVRSHHRSHRGASLPSPSRWTARSVWPLPPR